MIKMCFDLKDYRPLDRGGQGILNGTQIIVEMGAVPSREDRVVFPAERITGANPDDVECVYEVLYVEFYPLPSEVLEGAQVYVVCGRKS